MTRKTQTGAGGIILNRAGTHCDSTRVFLELLRNPDFIVERVIDSSLSGVILIVNINNPALIERLGVTIIHPTAKDEDGNIRASRPMTRFLMKFVFLTANVRYEKNPLIFKGIGGFGKKKEKAAMYIEDFFQEIEIHNRIYSETFIRNLSLTPAIFYGGRMNQENAKQFLRDLYEKSKTENAAAGGGGGGNADADDTPSDILERYYKFVSDPPKKVLGFVTNKIASKLIGSDWSLGVVAMEFAEDYITLLDHIKNIAGGDKKKMKPPNEEITTAVLKKVFLLYKLGYLHCDDHGSNIMINPNTKDIYIIDFGETIRNPIRDFRRYIEYDGSPYQPCDGIKSRFRGYVSPITEEMIQACMNDRSITTADGELIPPDLDIKELKLCTPQTMRNFLRYIQKAGRKRKNRRRQTGKKKGKSKRTNKRRKTSKRGGPSCSLNPPKKRYISLRF